MNREAALALDAADPLVSFRKRFVIADALLYQDGNSLGRLPVEAAEEIFRTVEQEWGIGLVRSWHDWVNLPATVGDSLAPLVGAGSGEMLITDQTSLNLFKLAAAAQNHTGRPDIVSDASNFPSDLYVLEGVAAARDGRLRVVASHPTDGPSPDDIAEALDDGVGLGGLSHVGYRSGAIADLDAITAVAHDHGALMLWNLAHSVGVVPVDLEAAGTDLAVGCTYKYLNGGPGAPGFLYVRSGLQGLLQQPIHGWFGHVDQFAFEADYQPAADIRRFSVGTPPVVSLRGAEVGIRIASEAGIEAIRAKSVALTNLLITRYDELLAPLGFDLASPRDSTRRGGHIAVTHGSAWQITQALHARDVVPDFRAPDVIRFGPAPLYTRFVDVWDVIEVLAEITRSGTYREYPTRRDSVS